MKNKYKTMGNKTILFIEKDKIEYEIIIDTEDLEKINCIKNYWRISISDNSLSVKSINLDGKNISLQKYILGLNNQEHIKFLNGNKYDFRKSNLITNKDYKINEYVLKKNGQVEILLTDYNGIEKARTLISIDDLEVVIHYKYRWKYSIVNGTPCVYSSDENGDKVYIEHVLLKTNKFVKHLNNNTLDNRRENLIILKKNKTKKRKNKRKKIKETKEIEKKEIDLNNKNILSNDIIYNESEPSLIAINKELIIEPNIESDLKQFQDNNSIYKYEDKNFDFNF